MPTIRQKQSTYAITILTFQRHRHFQRTANAELFITTLFQHRDKNRFQLHAFVVMPDHVHVLITPATNESTAKCISTSKADTPSQHTSKERSGTADTTNTVS